MFSTGVLVNLPKLLVPVVFTKSKSQIDANFAKNGGYFFSSPFSSSSSFSLNRVLRKFGIKKSHEKKNVVILGTGWGAFNFLKNVDRSLYDVTVISPRNFFVFTPLLPSVVSGTLSLRSCIMPLHSRKFHTKDKPITFNEAYAKSINPKNREIVCENKSGHLFVTPYDYLIVSVGSEINTFGTPGVRENALFLKEAEAARQIRERLLENFEEAMLPSTPQEKREQLLHFVVIGGGPTGVETAAEISDFIHEDAQRIFPKIAHMAKVSVIEMQNRLLPTYKPDASKATEENLRELNITVLLNTKVLKITENTVMVEDLSSHEKSELHCRFTLWASGVQMVPFTKSLIEALPEQKGNRVLKVNQKLQVMGGSPSIYALGDCAFVVPEKLADHAEIFYEMAVDTRRGPGLNWIMKNKKWLATRFPQINFIDKNFTGLGKCSSYSEFVTLLEKIDSCYKPPIQTAQHATQAGKYLAHVFNTAISQEEKQNAPCFIHKFKGSMAYIGKNQSIIQSNMFNMYGGRFSNVIWRSFYWMEQFSVFNRLLCLSGWFRTRIFGRDAEHERLSTRAVIKPEN